MRKLLAALFAAACLLTFSAEVWRASQHSRPSIPHYSAATKDHAASNHPTEEKAGEQALTRYTFWLTFFTGVLALATIGLGTATLWLYFVAERQIKLGRDEFVSTHRPKLIVRQFQVDPILKDQVITIRFSLINIGDTNAIPRYTASEIGLWNSDHWEAPGISSIVQKVDLPPIKGGQRISFTSKSNFVATEDKIRAIVAGNFIVCIVGEITYADAMGTNRRTGFRRAYDRITDKFVPSQDQDEEYCD
jgi:hypothetical protein